MATEKQIAYANDIRTKFLHEADELISKLDDSAKSDAQRALEKMRSFKAEIGANAQWWINRRNYHVGDVMEHALTGKRIQDVHAEVLETLKNAKRY